MARDEQQPMSDERLAEIAQFVFDLSMIGELGEHNVEHDYLRDLLAEVERLRASLGGHEAGEKASGGDGE